MKGRGREVRARERELESAHYGHNRNVNDQQNGKK